MKNFIVIILCMFSLSLGAQKVIIDGYAYESGNRGYLNTVEVRVYDKDGTVLNRGFSDIDGHFSIEVPVMSVYKVVGSKDMFHDKEMGIDRTASDAKVFVKLEMRRAPGYRFEITLANKRDNEDIVVDAIKGADIEVYNNTQDKMVLTLEDYDNPNFEIPLLKGNHYTLFVRKEGYLSKRMEAFVNVKDCILCFEGVGEVRPGVTDNLTEGNETGVLLANVELEKIYPGKELRINNIYYDTGSAEILPQSATELDNLITILEDNPHLKVELGSHTDSKGLQDKNLALSQKRAQKAVEYIVANSTVKRNTISYRGYGETKLLNKCTSFVECTDAEHAKNRRTEITVLGVDPNIPPISLADRIAQVKEADLINQLINQEQVKVTGDEKPDFLEEKNDLPEAQQEQTANPIVKQTMDDTAAEIMVKDAVNSDATLEQPKAVIQEEITTERVVDEAVSTESTMKPTAAANTSMLKADVKYYTIVYFFSRKELDVDHKARQFEGYRVNQDRTGNYLYHVGMFENENAAIQFLNEKVRPQYESAYITRFLNGAFVAN